MEIAVYGVSPALEVRNSGMANLHHAVDGRSED